MATVIIKKTKKNFRNGEKVEKTIYGVYLKSVLERKVCLNITEIGKSIKQNLEIMAIVAIVTPQSSFVPWKKK